MSRVFISYTHDSAEHRARVLDLAQQLRADGVDCWLDAFVLGHPEEGWPLWMDRQIESSDFVLLACTETYHRRFSGDERSGEGLGGTWESNLTRDHLYAGQGSNRKFVPILFAGGLVEHVPMVLRGRCTRYTIPAEYESLLRYLTAQPSVVPEPVGAVRTLPVVGTDANVGMAAEDDQGFAFSPSIRDHMAQLQRHVGHLTHDQFRVIRQLKAFRRVRISGCAGSGKTLVAAEKAIRLTEAGFSTLFLCHNPLLANHVRGLTRGSGVEVAPFGEWIAALAGERMSGSQGSWTHYEEPDSAALAQAFDRIVHYGLQYDAIIVDEGQDFRDEWWVVAEAALVEGEAGILYIFHDDLQALLPYRASYPVAGPPVDLSRNCRNAGHIYDLMRIVHPEAPLPEEHLRNLGEILVVPYHRGNEVPAVAQALNWIFERGLRRSMVALHGGTGSFSDALLSRSIPMTTPEAKNDVRRGGWRQAVHWNFKHMATTSQWGVDVFFHGPWDTEKYLKALSHEPYPTSRDVEFVRSLTHAKFNIHEGFRGWLLADPRAREPVVWMVREGKLLLTRPAREPLTPAELILHFERDDWHHGIPEPNRIRFQHYAYADPDDIPLYQVAEFKGLEADAVLLLLEGPGSDLAHQTYVGISRARLFLAMLVEEQTVASLPYALRTSRYLRGSSPTHKPR